MKLRRKGKWILPRSFGLCFIVCCGFLLDGCSTNGGQRAPVVNGNEYNGYYRVQRGDNLYRIGLRFNQSVSTLVRWNNLPNANAIEVGQLIRVRKPTQKVSTQTRPKKPATTPQRGNVPNKNSGGSVGSGQTMNIKLQWPVRGKVISNYNGQTQKGIDIAGTRGTPIKAAAAGTVQYAGDELRGYGRLILIKHNNSTITAYAHNDTMKVKNGQVVQAGQVIATMGDSGTNTVKLHFEVRVNSQAVNPLRYLPN